MPTETTKPLYKVLNEQRTQGEWNINHWSKGTTGVSCIRKEDGITYFTGDAVLYSYYGVRSKIDPMKYNIQGSFEGAHIAEIPDFNGLKKTGNESKANAQYTALAVNNLHILAEALEEVTELLNTFADEPVSNQTRIRQAIAESKVAISRIS